MIITEQKPLKEILEKIETFKKILIFGCGTCATACATGGEKEVQQLVTELKKNNKEILAFDIIESPCDQRLVKKTLRQLEKQIKNAEAVIVLACGSGVQTVAENLNINVIPGLNTLFSGKIKTLKNFEEGCNFCGECTLNDTNGICVLINCPKKLTNGPCGGAYNGKCEVDSQRDCVWALIYEKFKNQISKLIKIKKPKNLVKTIKPRSIKK